MTSIKEPSPTTSPVGELLTRQGVASRLHVHPETIKRMQRAGRIRAYVLGNNIVRYDANDVDALLSGAAVLAVQS